MSLPALDVSSGRLRTFIDTIVSTLPFGKQIIALVDLYRNVRNSKISQLVFSVFGGSSPENATPGPSFAMKPLRVLSSLALFLILALSSVNFIMLNVGIAFHPICEATFLSNSQFCRVVSAARQMTLPSTTYEHLNYPTLFDNGSQVLGDIVEGNTIISTTSLDLSKAHIAIDDLLLLVQYSTLSRKDAFLSSLDQLRSEAREAGFRLQNFAVSLDGSIDRIIFANSHFHDDLEEPNQSAMSLAHDSACTAMHLTKFPSLCPSVATFETERRFKHALVTFEEELKELTLRAFNLLGILERLDEHLRTILSLAKAERSDVIEAREVVQQRFLTAFGFNKKQLADYEEAISIVEKVTVYTALARDYVATSHSQLFRLQEEVIQARCTAAKSTKVEWIPIKDSAALVAKGIERLQLAQLRVQKEDGGLSPSLRAEPVNSRFV
ncbi:hypothetical protein SCHPADRAFT_946323 [Schizopora paradoxa]|uniref:Uncharacterized protein n=1 Tax=Schizopora paradoxa TaxID=27342 RepID=A0A0H2R495_9AGAM|nr:hypothetical protein SCHPADRAFT_946323 [Schizopora paradoxa]